MSDMPKYYTKKPIKIQAMKWTGNNLKQIIEFTGLNPSAEKWSWTEYEEVVRKDGLKIFTLEGSMIASIGDYIIKGIKGEFYPCKPDIFEASYSDDDEHEALRTGRITVSGDEYPTVVVDFQRDPSLTVALAGGSRWGEADNDIDAVASRIAAAV